MVCGYCKTPTLQLNTEGIKLFYLFIINTYIMILFTYKDTNLFIIDDSIISAFNNKKFNLPIINALEQNILSIIEYKCSNDFREIEYYERAHISSRLIGTSVIEIIISGDNGAMIIEGREVLTVVL